MRLLLTSAGITNHFLKQALEELLGKSTSESHAVFIPTALYGNNGGHLYLPIEFQELKDLMWKEFGVLELSAFESMREENWLPALEAADCIIVGGGNGHYLSYWMEKSGLFEKLPALLEKKVYMGISAGSMIVTASLGYVEKKLKEEGIYYDEEYDETAPKGFGMHKTLPVVNFEIRPHMNSDYFPNLTLENMEKFAAKIKTPMYAIDDNCAVKVVDGKVEVVGGGEWKLFDQSSK